MKKRTLINQIVRAALVMKASYPKRLLLALLTFLPFCASAYDFEVDSIYYNFTSDTDVEVTYEVQYESSYSGDVTIPEVVTYNGTTYAITGIGGYAFYDCSSLTSIDIPVGVTSIGRNAFAYCSSLAGIDIPDGVTSLERSVFYGCTSFSSIDIPDGVTSIGDYAFDYCTSLTDIAIPDGVTSIGKCAFSYCSSLAGIDIPDGVTSIEERTFSNCSSLTSIDLPDGVTSIGDFAFYYCTSLASIDIPDGVTSIEDYAFCNCTSLASIDLPDGVTSIGNNAFYACESLTEITIPSSVDSIGSNAFAQTKKINRTSYIGGLDLTDVYCLGKTPAVADSTAFGTPSSYSETYYSETYSNATLHVPSGCSAAYKAAACWSEFSTIVEDAETVGISELRADSMVGIDVLGTTVNIKGSGRACIYSADGSVFFDKTVCGTASISVPEGVYIVKVTDGKSATTKKIIVK